MSVGTEHFKRLPGCLQSEGHHFHRDRCVCSKPVYELAAVDNDGKPMASRRNDFFAQQRSAQSLNQIERAALLFVRTVDREIDLAMFAERSERNVRCLRL